MSDERRQIDGEWFFFYSAQEPSYIEGRTAAVSGDQRGHAHANEILRIRQTVDRFNVCVNVDETRGDDLAFGIDCSCCIGWIDSAEAGNATILNADVRPKPGIAAAVNNTPVRNQEIESRRSGLAARLRTTT